MRGAASQSPASFGNDEDNWFGNDDRDAQSRAEQSVAAVGARIVGAKPFPIAARRLEELTRNPKARLEQVVSVLETDPGLSVRLLRLVNSAGYGLKVRVTSVRHAAVLVGTRRLHQVATTAAILDLFDAGNETAIELLEHAAVVGSLCRYLAVHLGLPHDELFTCGFLHDIGKLMLLDTEGEKYAALVRTYGDAPDQLHIHERKLFGFDHAVLGAHVLTAWNIPDPVPKVVAFHHQPARAMQDTLLASMVHTLRVADMMSYAVNLATDEAGIAMVTESEAAQYLEISEPQVAAMWSDLRALADRSRSRSHGQPDLEVVAPRRLEVPRSLRPRRSGAPRSLRATDLPTVSLPAGVAARDKAPSSSSGVTRTSDVNEVPVHFACVACSKPSFGNLCAACGGNVCPEHQVGPDHWCVLCVQEHQKFRSKNPIPGYLKVTALALAGFSVGASVTGVMVSQAFSVWKLVVAPLSMLLLWGVLLPVAHRLWLRRRFLSTRPKGRVPLPLKLPRPNPVFISSLDANLESDGLMGPSLRPPSQSGISVIGLVAEAVIVPLEPELAASDAHSRLPAPTVSPSPTATDRSPAAPAPAVMVVNAGSAPIDALAEEAPASERALDDAAAALEQTSDVMRVLTVAPARESSGPLAGAAASLNPAPTPADASLAVAESIAQQLASLLGPSAGLSEFPSVGSGSELEQVVATVSARLVRDLPNNDYTGPSADLRAATIAPANEPEESGLVVVPPAPLAMVESPPAMPDTASESAVETPVVEASESVVEAPESVVEASESVVEAPESVVEAPESAVEAPVVEASGSVVDMPVVDMPVVDMPVVDAPVVDAPVVNVADVGVGAVPATALLRFSRLSLDHGCAPRSVFKCVIPIADSCSPAPRRTSLRPAASEIAVAEDRGPRTIRGLG